MSSGSPWSPDTSWWQDAVVYQLYPRSFNDANGDGVGDLPGVVEKVDYVDELGVDVVWLNPVYDSPLVDEGYDVRDYHAVLAQYGSLVDWEVLRERLHERDIKLVMDLVVNHTSDEHEWFERSRRRKGKYEDYYWWVDGSPAEPPNNWESFFGGPAWSYDHQRESWYLHLFDEKQPDLNWSNPAVREDVYAMMRWWLERDIDGFRMDVINLISKPDDLPDGDPDADVVGQEHFIEGPRVHEHIGEMHDRVLADYDVMTVGETPDVTVEEARRYGEDGLDMVFAFQHLKLGRGDRGPWDARDWDLADFREVVTRWQCNSGEAIWNSVFLGNHDQPRMVSRFGDDGEYRAESATMLGTLLLSLQGTPFLFQGDEIGMTNPTFHGLDEFRDIRTIERVREALEEREIDTIEEVGGELNFWSRDNARTPMQWSDEEQAGFTDGEPWIKVNENYPEVNVERQRGEHGSVLEYYRRMIDCRGERPVLVYGHYEPILRDDPEVLAYLRTHEDADERLLVVLNFFDGEPTFELPGDVEYGGAELVIGNYGSAEGDEVGDDGGEPAGAGRGDLPTFDLEPYEARIYSLGPP